MFLLLFISVFCLGLYPLGLVCMDFDVPGFENSSPKHCIEPVLNQVLAATHMRQFLTNLLNFWHILSVLILQSSDVLAISYFTSFGLFLPFLLLFLLLLDLSLDLLLLLLQLFCYFLAAVDFVQQLTGCFAFADLQLLST